MFEAEIAENAENLRTPSFNLKNVVLIKRKTCTLDEPVAGSRMESMVSAAPLLSSSYSSFL